MSEAHRLDSHKWCWLSTVGYYKARENKWNTDKILKHSIGIILKYIRHIVRAAAMDGFKEMAEVSPAVFAEICTPKYVIGEFADPNMSLVGWIAESV